MASESELDKHFRMHRKNRDFAVIFQNSSSSGKVLNYTIHTRNNNFHTDQTFLNNIYMLGNRDVDEYIDSGFLALQLAVNTAFDELMTTANGSRHLSETIEFEFEKFPLNARELRQFVGIGLTVVMLAFIYLSATLFSMVLVPMVEEKESGIKEFLRIASSYCYLNNFVFFTFNVIVGSIIFGGSMLIANAYGFLQHIQIVWLVLLLLLYIMSAIVYAYLMSVLFDSVFYAKTTGILCFLPPFLILMHHSQRFKWLVPLFSTNLLVNGAQVFDTFGQKGLVFTGANLFDTPTIENDGKLYSMFETYMYLLMCIGIYTTLYYYFSHVFPGKNGTPWPFYFPFQVCISDRDVWAFVLRIICFGFFFTQASFYRRDRGVSDFRCVESGVRDEMDGNGHSAIVGNVAVRIRGLSKNFRQFCGNGNLAVNNLSMDIGKNQITVLLGHNGAGKTTTMSMITGIIPKTSGTISVGGVQNVEGYRHKIGYCPQHNVFMQYFTCQDHLLFFGGVSVYNGKFCAVYTG